MFIGAYLAVCGIQYTIVMIVAQILIRRTVSAEKLRKSLIHYSSLALSISLLGLNLFSLFSIRVGNLHFNFPQDITNLKALLPNIPKITIILLGLAGISAPLWALLIVFPEPKTSQL
jgi:hypothetical protein